MSQSKLEKAIKKGNKVEVERLLTQTQLKLSGAKNIKLAAEQFLKEAAAKGQSASQQTPKPHREVLAYLCDRMRFMGPIELKAFLKTSGWEEAVFLAIRNDNVELLKLLFQHITPGQLEDFPWEDPNKTPLFVKGDFTGWLRGRKTQLVEAAIRGNSEIVEVLLAKGINAGCVDALLLAAFGGSQVSRGHFQNEEDPSYSSIFDHSRHEPKYLRVLGHLLHELRPRLDLSERYMRELKAKLEALLPALPSVLAQLIGDYADPRNSPEDFSRIMRTFRPAPTSAGPARALTYAGPVSASTAKEVDGGEAKTAEGVAAERKGEGFYISFQQRDISDSMVPCNPALPDNVTAMLSGNYGKCHFPTRPALLMLSAGKSVPHLYHVYIDQDGNEQVQHLDEKLKNFAPEKAPFDQVYISPASPFYQSICQADPNHLSGYNLILSLFKQALQAGEAGIVASFLNQLRDTALLSVLQKRLHDFIEREHSKGGALYAFLELN